MSSHCLLPQQRVVFKGPQGLLQIPSPILVLLLLPLVSNIPHMVTSTMHCRWGSLLPWLQILQKINYFTCNIQLGIHTHALSASLDPQTPLTKSGLVELFGLAHAIAAVLPSNVQNIFWTTCSKKVRIWRWTNFTVVRCYVIITDLAISLVLTTLG